MLSVPPSPHHQTTTRHIDICIHACTRIQHHRHMQTAVSLPHPVSRWAINSFLCGKGIWCAEQWTVLKAMPPGVHKTHFYVRAASSWMVEASKLSNGRGRRQKKHTYHFAFAQARQPWRKSKAWRPSAGPSGARGAYVPGIPSPKHIS